MVVFPADHRRDLPSVLTNLAETVLLNQVSPCAASNTVDSKPSQNVGIRLEQWPLRAQRELWSAVVSSSASILPRRYAQALAAAFLAVSERKTQLMSDSVCVTLARTMVKTEESNGDGNAFTDSLERLILRRTDFKAPKPVEEEEEVIVIIEAPSRKIDDDPATSSDSQPAVKRARLDVPTATANAIPAAKPEAAAQKPKLNKEAGRSRVIVCS